MPYQELGRGRLINAGRALLSAAIIFSASGCKAANLELSPQVAASTATAGSLPPTRVPFEEGPLNPEIVKSMEQSLVIFTRSLKPGYVDHNFSGLCNGFVVKDTQGKPLVATARHCFPSSIKSDQDGKTYSTIGQNGENILDARVRDITGQQFEALPYNHYLTNGQAKAPDVILFRVPDSRFNPPALTLDLSGEPSRWATRYRVSINNNSLNIHNYQFLERLPDRTLRFFSITYPEAACANGTSGSPIVNSKGEVMALFFGSITQKIDDRLLNQLQLESGYRGKKVVFCHSVASQAIQGLIRNP